MRSISKGSFPFEVFSQKQKRFGSVDRPPSESICFFACSQIMASVYLRAVLSLSLWIEAANILTRCSAGEYNHLEHYLRYKIIKLFLTDNRQAQRGEEAFV
jgi:hypothetical protein